MNACHFLAFVAAFTTLCMWAFTFVPTPSAVWSQKILSTFAAFDNARLGHFITATGAVVQMGSAPVSTVGIVCFAFLAFASIAWASTTVLTLILWAAVETVVWVLAFCISRASAWSSRASASL